MTGIEASWNELRAMVVAYDRCHHRRPQDSRLSPEMEELVEQAENDNPRSWACAGNAERLRHEHVLREMRDGLPDIRAYLLKLIEYCEALPTWVGVPLDIRGGVLQDIQWHVDGTDDRTDDHDSDPEGLRERDLIRLLKPDEMAPLIAGSGPEAVFDADWECLVVTGEPGSGKSGFAEALAAESARRALAKLDNARESGSPLSALRGIEIPVLCRVASLGGHELGDVVSAALDPLRLADYAGLLELPWRRVVILDGLDRVANAGASARSLSGLRATPSEQGPVRVAVTSRPADEPVAGLVAEKRDRCVELHLDGLGRDGLERFINAWFLDDHDSAERLLAHLDDNPRLGELVELPLFATMLCAAAEEGTVDEVPIRPAELFDRFVYTLLRRRWTNEPPPAAEVVHARLVAAASVARHLCFGGSGIRRQIDEGELVGLLVQSNVSVDDLSDLLVPSEGNAPVSYRFVHDSLGSFLAARSICGFGVPQAPDLSAVTGKWWLGDEWSEILGFVAGLMEDPHELVDLIMDDGPDTLGLLTLTAAELLAATDHPQPHGDLAERLRQLAVRSTPRLRRRACAVLRRLGPGWFLPFDPDWLLDRRLLVDAAIADDPVARAGLTERPWLCGTDWATVHRAVAAIPSPEVKAALLRYAAGGATPRTPNGRVIPIPPEDYAGPPPPRWAGRAIPITPPNLPPPGHRALRWELLCAFSDRFSDDALPDQLAQELRAFLARDDDPYAMALRAWRSDDPDAVLRAMVLLDKDTLGVVLADLVELFVDTTADSEQGGVPDETAAKIVFVVANKGMEFPATSSFRRLAEQATDFFLGRLGNLPESGFKEITLGLVALFDDGTTKEGLIELVDAAVALDDGGEVLTGLLEMCPEDPRALGWAKALAERARPPDQRAGLAMLNFGRHTDEPEARDWLWELLDDPDWARWVIRALPRLDLRVQDALRRWWEDPGEKEPLVDFIAGSPDEYAAIWPDEWEWDPGRGVLPSWLSELLIDMLDPDYPPSYEILAAMAPWHALAAARLALDTDPDRKALGLQLLLRSLERWSWSFTAHDFFWIGEFSDVERVIAVPELLYLIVRDEWDHDQWLTTQLAERHPETLVGILDRLLSTDKLRAWEIFTTHHATLASSLPPKDFAKLREALPSEQADYRLR